MSISQAQVSALRLQKILLSWDYWDLEIRSEAGSGAVKELHRVPKTFNSVQVCQLWQLQTASHRIEAFLRPPYAVRSTFQSLNHWC